MFKKVLLNFILLGLIFFALGFGKLGIYDPSQPSPFIIPEKYETVLKNYRSKWGHVVGLERSALHWNHGIAIFMNRGSDVYLKNYIGYLKTLEDDFEEEEDGDDLYSSYPEGTIVLKENYTLKNEIPHAPTTITMMIKREQGYDKKFGNWQYVQFTDKGAIVLDGNSSDVGVTTTCIDCHVNIKERDYLFSRYYLTK